MLGGSKFTYPSLLRRGRLRHKFFIRKCLFCGLSDLHCASVLFIEEVNGFESENGVAVSQTPKVKLSPPASFLFSLLSFDRIELVSLTNKKFLNKYAFCDIDNYLKVAFIKSW